MEIQKSIRWLCYNSYHVLVHTENHRAVKATGDLETWQRGRTSGCVKSTTRLSVGLYCPTAIER